MRYLSLMSGNDPFANGELDHVLRDAEVEAATGLGGTRRAELEAAGLFPKRVPIGARAVAWSGREVLAWQKQRLALRDDPEAAAQAKLERTPEPAARARQQRPKLMPAPA